MRPTGVDREVRTLSGGNQQKVVLARWLLRGLPGPPPRRADPRRRRRRALRDLRPGPPAGRRRRRRVVVSSEIEEVLGLSDRVLVIARGPGLHEARPTRSTSTGSSTSSWKETPRERERPRRPDPAAADRRRPATNVGRPPRSPPRRRAAEGSAARGSCWHLGRPQPRPGHRPRSSCASSGDHRRRPFASIDNVMTILRLASVIGVVSIGMTFVISGGGIDLSVGCHRRARLGLGDDLATQTMAEDFHWIIMVFTALAVGAGCGVVNGVLIAYGRMAPFIATWPCSPRPAAWPRSSPSGRPRSSRVREFIDFFNGSLLGIPVLVSSSPSSRPWAGSCSTGPPSAAAPRGRRQPRGRPAGRHRRPAAHGPALHAARSRLRHRRRHAHGPDDDRDLDPRRALRARRHRRGRHRRHPAHRWPRHDRRHRPRRADLHHADQRLHAQQPRHVDPGRGQGRHHRRRRPATAARGAPQHITRDTQRPDPPDLPPPDDTTRPGSHRTQPPQGEAMSVRTNRPFRRLLTTAGAGRRRRSSWSAARATNPRRERRRQRRGGGERRRATAATTSPATPSPSASPARWPTTAGSRPSTAPPRRRRRSTTTSSCRWPRAPTTRTCRSARSRRSSTTRSTRSCCCRPTAPRSPTWPSGRWRPASPSSTSTASSPRRSRPGPRSWATTTAWASRPAHTPASSSRRTTSATRSSPRSPASTRCR